MTGWKNLAASAAACLIALAVGASGAFAAPEASGNPLTPGNVSLHLRVGQTTQEQVLEVFGAPNIVTQDGQSREVWSYQRHATVTKGSDSGAYFDILVAGAGRSKSSLSETQRTMTLIIKFGPDHIVSDFNSRSSEF